MNNDKKAFHLLVTFTYNVSLKEWFDTGLIGRELILYKQMVKNGNSVTLLTYGDSSDYDFIEYLEGINVIPIFSFIKRKKNRWSNLAVSFFIAFIFKKHFKSADIIKTNQMSGAWVALTAKIIYRKKLVVRCGFEMLRNLLRDEKRIIIWLIKAIFGYLLEYFAYSMADNVIISNCSDHQFILRYYPVKPEKIRMIRNFIDTVKFSSIDKNKICAGDKSILFIGRLVKRKNLESLIKAAALAAVRLDIIGTGNEEIYLKKIAEQESPNIHFWGKIDNRSIPDFINKHRLFMLPSFYENNPKTLLEAMSCATVVIGTDVDGIRELIENGVSGFLCKTDEISISQTIIKATQMSREEYSRMGERARAFVKKECALKNVYIKETGIYRELMKQDMYFD